MSPADDLRRIVREHVAGAIDPQLDKEPRRKREFIERTVAGFCKTLGLAEAEFEPIARELVAEMVPAVLRIDWGLDLRVGLDLTPKFHLLCPAFDQRPCVTFPLDKRLETENWSESPQLRMEDPSHWSFTQEFRLKREGVYRLDLRAAFEESQPTPRCLRAEVTIQVADPGQGAGPTVTIEADGASVVHMGSIDTSKFKHVVVKAAENAVVWGRGASPLAPPEPAPAAAAEPAHFVVDVPLRRDWDLERQVPAVSPIAGLQRARLDAASLVLPFGRRVILSAKPGRFGRQHDTAPERNPDHVVVLRLDPMNPERQFLSQLISRDHLSLKLQPDGLLITDEHSTFGTFLDGRPVEGGHTIAPADLLARPHPIDVAGVLGLDLTAHPDAKWDEWKPCQQDFLERQYCRAVGGAIRVEWNWAQATHLDAVRLRRQRQMPVRRYREPIKKGLVDPALVEQFETVINKIFVVDELAGREEYVFLFRTATIGGVDSDAISIPGHGLPSGHARLLHLDGCFWVEHLGPDPQRGTLVNGQPLPPHRLAPLSPGTRLSFGGAEVVFDRCQRVHLSAKKA